jgi:serine/threonine-protein kinase
VWKRLEVVLERFEDSWRAGERPALDDFLEGVGAERRALLIELVHADLHYRLKAGEAVRVESYLSRFPELSADDGVVLELVWQELELRRRQDPAVDVGEYLERFPQLVARLQKRLRISTSQDAKVGGPCNAGEDAGILDLRDFELLDRLGQGGMGEVYRGRDPALGRDLAVKMLRTELRGSSEAERRFRLEALVTGSLQHPNIVPVHNLGRLPDGRLYFTMKLVRGRTLADMLAEGNGAGQRSELLGVFEKVCQAVAFAHSRGVIHRDLKPANVMVGAFGEVQVMDWGLGKVLRSNLGSEIGNATELGVTPKDPPRADHQTGVVGTPAYMPPEQAGGTGDEMDERADVFGLGTILCEILTGRPPYSGDRIEQILSRAASGDTAEALVELNECGADAELVALCRECLATDRTARPRNGQEVAERLLTYQTGVQDRLRKAELERAAAEAQEQEAQATARAERRALRRTQALAVAVLLAVAAFGGVGWVLWDRAAQQAERTARTEQTVRVALAKTQQLAEQARQMPSVTSAEAEAVLVVWRQADDSLAQAVAVQMTGTANDELRQQVVALQVQLAEQRQETEHGLARALRKEKLFRSLADARMAMATVKESNFDYAGAAAKHQAAFAEYGIEVRPEHAEELGKRIRTEEPAVREALIVGLDHWALCNRKMSRSRTMDLLAIARAADKDQWRREYREAVVKGDGAALVRLSQVARHSMLPPESLELLAVALKESRKNGEALALLRWARRRHPKDFWLAMELGNYLDDPKAKDRVILEEQIGCYRVAVALEPKAIAAHHNLGVALHVG